MSSAHVCAICKESFFEKTKLIPLLKISLPGTFRPSRHQFDHLITETPSLWRRIDVSQVRRIHYPPPTPSLLPFHHQATTTFEIDRWNHFQADQDFAATAVATAQWSSTAVASLPLTISRASNGDLRVSPVSNELDSYGHHQYRYGGTARSTYVPSATSPKRRRYHPPRVLERLLSYADELVLETNDLLDEVGLQCILSQTHPTFEDQGQAADKGRLQALTISSFRYGTSSGLFWPVLAALAQQPQLKRLTLHGDLSIYLGRLSRFCPMLEHLDLSNTRVMDIWTYTWQDQDVVSSTRVVEIEDRRMFPRLRTLNLAHCFLDTWGLEPFLRRLPLPELEVIDLSGLVDLQHSHLMGLRVVGSASNDDEDAGRPTKLRRVVLKDLDWLTEVDVEELQKHWVSQRHRMNTQPRFATSPLSRVVHGLHTPPEDGHLLNHFPKRSAPALRPSYEIVIEHNAKLRSDDEEGYRDYIGRISSPAIIT